MKCPRCQQESPADADFCPECAAKLAVVCVACGTANAPPRRSASRSRRRCCCERIRSVIDRRRFLLTSLAGAFAAPSAAEAQQAGKVYRVDVLAGSAGHTPRTVSEDGACARGYNARDFQRPNGT